MKLNIKKLAFISVAVLGIFLVGCMPISLNDIEKLSDIEKVAITVLDTDELISIKEVELDKSGKKKNSNKDLEINLNLPHSAKNIALDNALLKSVRVIKVLEETFEDKLNNYKFNINTNQFDVYGNEQKIKILEISIVNEEVEKINFDNFDYKNLVHISEIKKFNFLKEESEENDKNLNEIEFKEESSSDKLNSDDLVVA